MAVSLNNIESADYEDFLQITINDYAASKVKNKTWLAADSVSNAIKAFNTLLPDGMNTQDQYFKTILHDGGKAGYLWFEIRTTNDIKVAFINFIFVFPSYRKLGLAKETLMLLKKLAISMGAERIELHVFGFNAEAINLYLRSGFEATNITMRCEL